MACQEQEIALKKQKKHKTTINKVIVLYFHIPLLSFVQDKIETLNIEKMLEEKNDNLQKQMDM
jgi:hypothetical protein